MNPYQSPMASCSQEDAALGEGCYSAHKCPQCRSEVTFWIALKQLTPFRFKCPHCRLRCRVCTPYMPLIFIGVCSAALLGALGVGLGIIHYGFITLSLAMPLLIALWIGLEVLTHRYIT